MKQIAKTFVIAIFFLFIAKAGFSQLSVSYYSSSLSKIGLGYNFSEKAWGELRLYSNSTLEDITPEIVYCRNITRKERHLVYLGIGINANHFMGIVAPIGVQFIPIEKFKQFSLHIEMQPMYDGNDSELILQSSWGLRYRFK